MIPHQVKPLFLNRYLVFLAGIFLYLFLTNGLIELTKGVWQMEIPLLMYLYFWMNALIRPSPWQAWVAALPLAASYMIHDYYYIRFFRIPKLVEVTQIPELVLVLGWGELLTYVALLLILAGILVAFVRGTRRGAWLSVPLLLVIAAPFLFPSTFIQFYSWRSIEVIHYSSVINVEYNGRLASLLYSEAKRREILGNIAKFRDIEKLSLVLPPDLVKGGGGNVHLIALESFLDTSLFAKLPKARESIHPDFTAMFSKHRGSSYSPVFGGYTAQAEFEFLCGVPAFQEFDEIEFNSFTGAESYCLPTILKKFGYRSVASNGYKPDFFNATKAYASIGFDEAYFPVEYAPGTNTYLSKGEDKDNKYFFDADLYKQNREFVAGMLKEKKPFFNFVMTVYGHLPFHYDNRVGPPVVAVPDVNPVIERILNQHYYRGKALVDHVRQLMAMDPQSLIILVSDHLPPFPRGKSDYEELGYRQGEEDPLHKNLFFVIRNGQMEIHENFMHFNITRLILDYVTHGEYCRVKKCDFGYPVDKEALREDYRIILGLATR